MVSKEVTMSQPTIGHAGTGPSGATHTEQDSHGPKPYRPEPLSAADERTWAVAAHLSPVEADSG